MAAKELSLGPEAQTVSERLAIFTLFDLQWNLMGTGRVLLTPESL